MKCFQKVILLALYLHTASGQVINFQKCPGESSEKCTIHEVSITPCPEAKEENPCTLYVRSKISLTIDFTPKFAADELSADAFVILPNSTIGLPFFGLNTAACKYTNCPVVSGKRQTYAYDVQIRLLNPPQQQDLMWKLTSENDDTCCFIAPINVSRNFKQT